MASRSKAGHKLVMTHIDNYDLEGPLDEVIADLKELGKGLSEARLDRQNWSYGLELSGFRPMTDAEKKQAAAREEKRKLAAKKRAEKKLQAKRDLFEQLKAELA